MTTVEIKKLVELDREISRFDKLLQNMHNYTLKINFVNTDSYDNYIVLDQRETSLVRKTDIIDTIYSCLEDTLENLKEMKNNLILCTKEENTTYKPADILTKNDKPNEQK